MFALILSRVLWMFPTLWIISLVSFALIQLPPGDYLTSYITALEETGETVSMEQVEALRKRYNLDEPFVQQYSKWLNDLLPFGFRRAEDGAYLTVPGTDGSRSFNWPGFKWPDLGTSFEWNRSVGDLIGERLLLTMTISVFTLLFTWALAIPIGIYSAVRQYSWGDYTFSILGFIGLATPNFLLALVFMYIGYSVFGVSAGGLFSAAYENAPWSLAKFWDLLAHMWIPVIVIGTAGTAGLIRVMRGNLLDELPKQYVMTARAKGVSPIRLLLKYPRASGSEPACVYGGLGVARHCFGIRHRLRRARAADGGALAVASTGESGHVSGRFHGHDPQLPHRYWHTGLGHPAVDSGSSHPLRKP